MNAMMPETTMLLWSVVLGLVQLVIASMATNKDVGLPYNLSSRDVPPSAAVGKTAGRLVRAFNNFRETFGFFAVAVMLVAVLNRHDQTCRRWARSSISGRGWSMCRSMRSASRWCAPLSGRSRSSAW